MTPDSHVRQRRQRVVSHIVFVDLDTQSWQCRQLDRSLIYNEWSPEIAFTQVDKLLDQEVGYACINLEGGRKVDRAVGIMRSDCGKVALRHSGDVDRF